MLDADLTADARFLRTPHPGGHSNVGGGNHAPGLEAAAFNGMVDYLNGLRDKPLFTYRALPDDASLYMVYQARGVTAVPGLDGDGLRDEREDLANCSIVDPCRDAEPINEALASRFEYRQLKPVAPTPTLPVSHVATRDGQATSGVAATPDHPSHPQHGLLKEIREQVREREREGAIQFQDETERERFCRYALAACKDNRDELSAMYPDRDMGSALVGDGLVRADHVVIGTKQYAFVIQGDIRDPLGERVTFTMDRAKQTPVEQSDLKLAQANEEIARHKEFAREQELSRVPEESLKPAFAR
jgi:hypothetical protein